MNERDEGPTVGLDALEPFGATHALEGATDRRGPHLSPRLKPVPGRRRIAFGHDAVEERPEDRLGHLRFAHGQCQRQIALVKQAQGPRRCCRVARRSPPRPLQTRRGGAQNPRKCGSGSRVGERSALRAFHPYIRDRSREAQPGRIGYTGGAMKCLFVSAALAIVSIATNASAQDVLHPRAEPPP